MPERARSEKHPVDVRAHTIRDDSFPKSAFSSTLVNLQVGVVVSVRVRGGFIINMKEPEEKRE